MCFASLFFMQHPRGPRLLFFSFFVPKLLMYVRHMPKVIVVKLTPPFLLRRHHSLQVMPKNPKRRGNLQKKRKICARAPVMRVYCVGSFLFLDSSFSFSPSCISTSASFSYPSTLMSLRPRSSSSSSVRW